MSDLFLQWRGALWAADLVTTEGGDLLVDGGLETAVTLSLFTDARADEDDALPAGAGTDRRGWWGDALPMIDGYRLGSKLWLLSREKITARTMGRAKQYAEEALAWMITSGLAKAIEVTVDRTTTATTDTEGAGGATTNEGDGLGLQVTITRPDGAVSYRYDHVWHAQSERKVA